MPKSLSELQQSPDVGLPERTVKICVAARLVDEAEAIDAELFEVEEHIGRLEQQEESRREGGGPPRRTGERSELPDLIERGKALAAKADATHARIDENMVEVLLRGKTRGEWRQWASKHPARDEATEPQGFERDKTWAGGHVDIDALAADLHLFAVKYNGEDASDAWADFVASKGAPGHLTLAASRVVAMHEAVVSVGGKAQRSEWFASRRSATASE